MRLNILHVYRNTPLGRETLWQAADFTRKTNGKLQVYIPQYDRFLFYFERQAVEIRLDQSYLYLPQTAKQNVQKILAQFDIPLNLVQIRSKTASTLPNLPTNFDLLSLPRIMVERQGRIHLAAMGTGIRQIVKNAPTPALISPGRFHDWNEMVVLFGGSEFSITALKWALAISKQVSVPLNLITLSENKHEQSYYEKIVQDSQIDLGQVNDWRFIESNSVLLLLDEIPREAMIVMGAYGQGRIISKLFGSKTELIQRNTANLTMLIGENCRPPKVN
ncbi:MAG: hypothetical protein ACE5HI_00410 [bacterium]